MFNPHVMSPVAERGMLRPMHCRAMKDVGASFIIFCSACALGGCAGQPPPMSNVAAAVRQPVEGAARGVFFWPPDSCEGDRKSTRLNSSHPSISYAVFCLKKKKKNVKYTKAT